MLDVDCSDGANEVIQFASETPRIGMAPLELTMLRLPCGEPDPEPAVEVRTEDVEWAGSWWLDVMAGCSGDMCGCVRFML